MDPPMSEGKNRGRIQREREREREGRRERYGGLFCVVLTRFTQGRLVARGLCRGWVADAAEALRPYSPFGPGPWTLWPVRAGPQDPLEGNHRGNPSQHKRRELLTR